MSSWLIDLISDLIGSGAVTIQKFLQDLYYFVFYIEQVGFSDIEVNFDEIYNVIYSWASIILIIVFIKKLIQTYFLWKSGEDDISPVHVLIGLFEAIIIMICFGEIYTYCIDIGENLFQTLRQSIGGEFEISELTSNLRDGIFTAIMNLILFIEFLILIWQFIRRGIEILIMRCIIPFTAIGLLNSNGGAFAVILKKFLQNISTVIIQLLLMYLAMVLAKKGHIIYAIAMCMVANQTPQFLSDFLVTTRGLGAGKTINRAIDTVHDFTAIFKKK